LQRDRASAFVVDPVSFLITSSLITMQNLVVVSHTVHVQGHSPLEGGQCDDMRIRFDTTPACDGQTDGQTDGSAVTISRSACIDRDET